MILIKKASQQHAFTLVNTFHLILCLFVLKAIFLFKKN